MTLLNRLLASLSQTPIDRRIAGGFAVALLLLAAGFGLSFYNYSRYNEAHDRVENTYQVINGLNDILSLTKDVETGVRGYLVSGDSLYLEPYRFAKPQFEPRLTSLRTLIVNPAQRKRIDSLQVLVQEKLEIASQQINIRRLATGQDSWVTRQATADLRMLLLLGKLRMDRLRRWSALMINAEQQLMVRRNEQADRSFRAAQLSIGLLLLLTSVALLISYRLLTNELQYRREMEIQLRAYEAQLTEQIRQLESSNEELERFAFVASHDLQEPLRKIQAFGSLLAERNAGQLDAEGYTFIRKITQSAERMSKMVKDLLGFSRLTQQPDVFQPVDLADVVRRVIDDQELRIAATGARIEVGPLPTLDGVPARLDQLFMNLITNALKFQRPQVPPVVQIDARPVDGSQYPGLLTDGSYIEIRVADNGIGFDEKYLDHIFKVFQRLHPKTAYEGTGIGLAVCKKVVSQHHGYLTARSQPGQGATFLVILPSTQTIYEYDRRPADETRSHPVG